MFTIRALQSSDQPWVAKFGAEHWGSDEMVVGGKIFRLSMLPGFVALADAQVVGLATYDLRPPTCEMLSLNSLKPALGIGSALIEAVKEAAIAAGCQRLCLATTNDNTDALRFYQRRGFAICEFRRDATTEARKIKPEIPLIGEHGIPIRDEIELEILLVEGRGADQMIRASTYAK